MGTAGERNLATSRRSLFSFLFAGGLAALCNQDKSTVIYAGETWYRERPEPEREWRGLLQARTPQKGPASRTALLFTLVLSAESIAVYAAGVKDRVAPFTGMRVIARGKLVDLTSEGYGRELWIADIRSAR
jgi:hypothetical protein